MGIEEDFYATLKLKTGEEIFAKVAASEEEDRTILIVSNPIIVAEIKSRMGIVGYKLEPWLKTTKDDMFIINLEDVLTLSESSDVEMIMMYQTFVRQSNKDATNMSKINRRMGYIANVNDAKEFLEKLYKNN
jgi:Sm_like domain